MRNKIEFINFKLQVATFQQINDWTLPLNEFIILKKKKKKTLFHYKSWFEQWFYPQGAWNPSEIIFQISMALQNILLASSYL